jgi:hypothetical protein
MALFQGKNGGVPFPRTHDEWVQTRMSKGYSYEAANEFATKKIRDDVFGADHRVDARGNPIENGIGSASNQTHQHKEALERAAGARAAMRSKVGYTPALAGTFDPKKGA